MTRLSDRALQTLKEEVNRYYTPTSQKRLSQQQDVERVIVLARLEALHERGGQAVTQAQLWEEICDIIPNFDRKILKRVGRVDITKPLADASLGLGVASIGAAALLLANPISFSEPFGQGGLSQRNTRTTDAQQANGASKNIKSHQQKLYETAKAFGWQAALKGQNPPHSVEHWRETASLWEQAIALLDQVPSRDRYYPIAQAKKAEYQKNLKHIQARQAAAQNENMLTPKPQFSKRIAQSSSQSSSQAQPSITSSSVAIPVAFTKVIEPETSTLRKEQDGALALARQHGWDAAIAGQNAPHPAEKWADVSRLWQLALQDLNKIDIEHPDYAEAQLVKAQYEQNLSAIRTRYQQEQAASQKLQSLQASLIELERRFPMATPSKENQVQAIVSRLQSIPAGTMAHAQAQQLIVSTSSPINMRPVTPVDNGGIAITEPLTQSIAVSH